MTALPLPGTFGAHVAMRSASNRSLVFDRGFDGYDGSWSIPTGDKGKQAFLTAFRDGFSRGQADYEKILARRRRAVEAAGAEPVRRFNQTRLVIGLGLPHPTETALLLDALTGCPYLPGSSVKGVLRQAAGLAAAGDLPTGEASDGSFWQRHFDRLFGPALGGESVPAKGELRVYDVFPDRWPTLEVDVLTPHYAPYYGDGGDPPREPPADWHDPVPVAFPTVRAGTAWTFWIGHRKPDRADEELPRARRLLDAALEWLGVGGKTSSGYGVFGKEPPAVPTVAPGPEESDSTPPPPQTLPLKPGEARWEGAELLLDRGRPTVKGPGGELARGLKDDVPEAVFERLRQSVVVKADAVVKTRGGGRWALVRVERTHS